MKKNKDMQKGGGVHKTEAVQRDKKVGYGVPLFRVLPSPQGKIWALGQGTETYSDNQRIRGGEGGRRSCS